MYETGSWQDWSNKHSNTLYTFEILPHSGCEEMTKKNKGMFQKSKRI